jgi:hypothetical protein
MINSQSSTSSFSLLIRFYLGELQCLESEAGIEVVIADNLDLRRKEWLFPGNHNHLRITRILTSMKLLGLDAYCQALFKQLDLIYRSEPESINARTYQFWCNAVMKNL